MPTYGRLVGLLSLTTLLGVLLTLCAAEPRGEPLRGDDYLPPVQCVPGGDPITLPEPIIWEDATPTPKPELKPTVRVRGSRAVRREALIAEILPILEQTHSAAAFLTALEVLVALDAPPEQVVPVCLRALERLDEFKPLPNMSDEAKVILLEGVGEGLRTLLEKKVRVGRATPTPSVTMPSAQYLEHAPQYFPPAPPFPMVRELGQPNCGQAVMGCGPMGPMGPMMVPFLAGPPRVVIGGVVGGPGPMMHPLPAPVMLPDPVPMAPACPRSRQMTEPQPVQVPAAGSPITMGSLPQVGPMMQDSNLIPVSTLPVKRRANKLEEIPATYLTPGRLVPVPTAAHPASEVPPCPAPDGSR